MQANTEAPDQTAQMSRLVLIFAVCQCSKVPFRSCRPIYILQYNFCLPVAFRKAHSCCKELTCGEIRYIHIIKYHRGNSERWLLLEKCHLLKGDGSWKFQYMVFVEPYEKCFQEIVIIMPGIITAIVIIAQIIVQYVLLNTMVLHKF